MSTEFPIYPNKLLGLGESIGNGFHIQLREQSCHFELVVFTTGEFDYESPKLNTSEVIDIACNLLGPLAYYTATPERILKEVERRLRERGYIT
jgi:hypothetical protein